MSLFHSFLKYGFGVQPTLPFCTMSLFSVFFLLKASLMKMKRYCQFTINVTVDDLKLFIKIFYLFLQIKFIWTEIESIDWAKYHILIMLEHVYLCKIKSSMEWLKADYNLPHTKHDTHKQHFSDYISQILVFKQKSNFSTNISTIVFWSKGSST